MLSGFCLVVCLGAAWSSTLHIRRDVIGRASPHLVGFGIEDVNHELYGGLYSQMVYGEDFEEPAGFSGVSGDLSADEGNVSPTWIALSRESHSTHPAHPVPAYELVVSDTFNGRQAQLLMSAGTTPARILNRGLYQQGMHFEEGREYTGYLFARLSQQTSAGARLRVSLFASSNANISEGSELAAEEFELRSNQWTRLSFSLTPRSAASCRVTKASKRCKPTPEDECVVCEGGLVLAAFGGAVVLDFVFMQPGLWGRFQGTPARRDVVQQFVNLGLTALRLGGSMCNVEGYRWKNMRGPREHRQPYAGLWHPYASQGWRIFEFLELCEHLGVQAVVTLNRNEDPEDLADLVEYAYGGADTYWGGLRIRDGHPMKYKPFLVEIGNEENLDWQLVRAVADGAEAMRLRAEVVGMDANLLKFAIGHNLDMALINTPLCDTMVNATKFLGDAVMWDFHVDGDAPGQVDHWNSAFQMAEDMLDRLQSKMRLAVFEENAQAHDLVRGLNRARFANTYARLGKRFAVGTAANGMQVFGLNDNKWDQGAVFFTPDSVWLSPFGYADLLIARSSLPIVLQVDLDMTGTEAATLDVSASRTEDFKTIALRVVNYDTHRAASLSLKLPNGVPACKGGAMLQELKVPFGLKPTTVNPPSNRTRVAPSSQMLESISQAYFPPLSLTILVWSDCSGLSAVFV